MKSNFFSSNFLIGSKLIISPASSTIVNIYKSVVKVSMAELAGSIVLMKWISNGLLAVVTEDSVFHWDVESNNICFNFLKITLKIEKHATNISAALLNLV